MRECNPPKAGVLGPVFEAITRLKNMTPLDKDPVRMMGAWSYHLSGILSLNNLAGGFPALRPYVAALEAGESIRASLQMRFGPAMRKVAALKGEDSRAITRIMEVEDAEGRLATENADGTASITPTKDHVGSKRGETITLSKELNETRKDVRRAIDDTYTYMIEATKAAMGYTPGDKVKPQDQKVLDLMETFRKKGYIPHVRAGSWGVQYNLKGVRHFESFEFDLSRGTKASGRTQALDRISKLKAMGATDISPPLDLKARRELLDKYIPTMSTLGKMDVLFQSILSPPSKKGAAQEVRRVLDMLRKEAAAKSPRLRERENIPGWLTEDNYDTYLRGMFAPFIASTTDWIANTSTREFREKAIADLSKIDPNLTRIAENQEDYLHSDEAAIAQLKSLAFLYTLGFNLSSAIVNLTQPLHTSLPLLGGIGGAGNASKQLARAYKDAGLSLERKFDPDEILKIEKLPADVRAMVSEMFRRGVAEALLTRDQAPAALTQTTSKAMYSLGRNLGRVMEVSSYAFTAVEQMNRVAVAIAAFRMAQDPKILKTFQDLGAKVGRDVKDATDAAEFAIRETQFVTSKPFRGRYMHGMIGGLGLQFMSFPIQMLGFIHRAARYYGGEGIFKSPEGRRVLGLMALGLFATAGLWGMPFAGPAGDSLDWLTKQLGPSLGMSPTNTRIFLRDTLRDVFKDVPSLGFLGTPAELANMVMYGPFRATGIDISQRTALDIIQFNPFQFDIFDFGPLGGAVFGGARDAANYASKGETMMAVASLFPLAFRNLARSVALEQTGYITPGKFEPTLPAEKVSDLPTRATVALGFRPTKVSEAAEAKRDVEELISTTDSMRRSYSDKIATATVKAINAKDPGTKQKYLKEAQDLRREVSEYDRGRPLMQRIVRDPASFQSSIQDKIVKLRTPQRPESVPPAARAYYMERLRENT